MSSDPKMSMQRVRQQAIEVSQKLVVADATEELVGGWTLLTPQQSNAIKSPAFEEAVLLLTDAALYACRFDWNIEKVSSFERIDLRNIQGVKYGTYITSTLTPTQSDETRNVGLVVRYRPGTKDVTRVNTRSMSSVQVRDEADGPSGPGLGGSVNSQKQAPIRILALKSLPSKSAVAHGEDTTRISEMENVKTICSEIERVALAGQVREVTGGEEEDKKSKSFVEAGDIISLAEAKRNTGLLDHLGHNLKRMVWG